MANIFIDPVIVMTPSNGINREEIEGWLANLDTWLNEALSAHYTWLHSVEVTNLLQEYDRFPSFELLRRWQRSYRLDVNPVQIMKKVNEFFRNENFDLGNKLVELGYVIQPEEGSIVIQPDQFAARWTETIRDHMHLLLATTCACKYTQHSFTHELHIATLTLKDAFREIEVSAVILDAIPDFVRGADNRIMQYFPLLFTPNDLLPLINVIELWNEGEKGIRYAIDHEYKKRYQSSSGKLLEYRLGSRFIESIHEARLDTNEIVLYKIIRAAAAIIADKAKYIEAYELHWLRKSEAANSPQRVRVSDNAKAWRLMVEKQGAGWRLHYWQIPGINESVIEFSNLQKESGREIY